MTTKIDINTGSYFPTHFIFLGFLLGGVGIFSLFTSYPIVGIILILVGIAMISTRYGLEINLEAQVYDEYISIFFWRNHHRINFNAIEQLYIRKGKYAKTMNSYYGGSRSTVSYEVFTAYIVFEGLEKVFLMEQRNKEKLIKQLSPISTALNIQITDQSSH